MGSGGIFLFLIPLAIWVGVIAAAILGVCIDMVTDWALNTKGDGERDGA